MFMPVDKLFNNLDLPKAILQSEAINIYEASFYEVAQNFCVIEHLVSDQNLYLSMSSSVSKYTKLDHPNILKIYYWSCEFLLRNNEKIYKFYFITDHFDRDMKTWIFNRNQTNLFFFERDIYKLTRDLSLVFKYLENTKIPLNIIKKENFVVSNSKIKFVPQTFLIPILEKLIIDGEIKNKVIISKFEKLQIETDFNDKKNRDPITSAQINDILKETNSKKILKSANLKRSPSPKRNMSPKKDNINSNSPKNRHKINSQEEMKEFEGKELKNKDNNEDSIFDFGILIISISLLLYTQEKDCLNIASIENFQKIEKKYGKEFSNSIKSMLSKEKNKKISFHDIYEEMTRIIKFKGNEEESIFGNKKKGKINTIIKINQKESSRIRFMHCFPELYQKFLYITIQNKTQIFYEVQDLNIDFVIPMDHRSIGVKTKNSVLVFLLGGKNTNNVHTYNPETKEFIHKESMISNLERRSFGLCCLNENLYVVGGICDSDITNNCEMYDIEANYWSKIACLNDACTDLSICSFNEKYIFKFGGQLQSLTLCQTIEKYEISKDKWIKINYKLDKNFSDSFTLLRNSLVAQIQDDAIIIIGGINVYFEGASKVFTFEVKEEEIIKKDNKYNMGMSVSDIINRENQIIISYELKNFNMYNLLSKDALDLCTPIIVDDELYILQFKKNNHRKLFALSNEWKEMKDIKW